MPTQKTSTGKTEFPFLDFDMTKRSELGQMQDWKLGLEDL